MIAGNATFSMLLSFIVANAALWSSQAAESSPASPGSLATGSPRQHRMPVTDPTSGIAGAELKQRGRSPLNDPEWRGAAQADHMQPDDPVLGLSLDGKSWAVPLWVLMGPHVANLRLEGEPLLISFCERCRSAIARSPVVKGRRLTFYLTGIYNGSILLADYETNSYWTPSTGEALEGALKGAKLKQVPLIQSQWKRWLEMHPETLVAYGPKESRERYEEVHRQGTFRVIRGLLPSVIQPLDRRLPFDDLVLGVTVGDQTRAYPLAILDEASEADKENVALNDTLRDKPIVILHQRGGPLTTAFSRRLRGKTLQFNTDKDGRFVDSAYHSHWNYHGEAVDGPVAGQKLSYIASQLEDWYVWAAFHPATSIYPHAPAANN